jgi:hypothetical protein
MQESLRQLSDLNEGAMAESSRTAARLADEGWVAVGRGEVVEEPESEK